MTAQEQLSDIQELKSIYEDAQLVCVHLQRLLELDTHVTDSRIEANVSMLQHAEKHIDTVLNIVLPYAESLKEKVQTGHDCSNCSGTCNVEHAAYIAELKQGRNTICKLWNDIEKIDEEDELESLFRSLRNKLAGIFLRENSLLLPYIADAQKIIKADV